MTHTPKKPLFKRSKLTACILAVTALQAHAQQQADGSTAQISEEIIVYGMKQSLQNAQDIKRDADTVVDAISASDIGALPDRSVLEALQRVPGISIERFASPEDPDHFAVEGSGVVIRGLTQTRSEFNGRDTFTANNGRGLSFQDVPPELMGAVEVAKNQTADMIEGGISGTVNLKTRLPFDADGRVLSFSLEGTYSDLAEELTPTGSLLYSDSWETRAGRFGFLVNIAGSNLKSRTDGVQVEKYITRTNIDDSGQAGTNATPLYVPRGANIRTQEHDRDREGFATAVQWENNSETVLVSSQVIRSKSTAAWTERALEFQDTDWNNSVYGAGGSALNFDNDGFLTSGTLNTNYGPLRNRFEQDGTPVGRTTTNAPAGDFGAKYVAQSRANSTTNTVTDYGLNAKFTPNEKITFAIDAQYVKADVENLDFSLMNGFFGTVALDLEDGTPSVTFIDPFTYNDKSSPAGDQHFADPSSYFIRSAMDHIEQSSGDSGAIAFDLDYELDGKFFTSVETGLRLAKRQQESRWARYNWKAISEAWSSWGAHGDPQTDQGESGPKWLDQWGTLADGSSAYEQYSFDNFQRGGIFGNEGQTFIFPNIDLVQDYDRARELLAEGKFAGSQWRPLPDRVLENSNNDPITADGSPCYGDYCYIRNATNNGFRDNEINVIEESTQSLYLKANFGNEDVTYRYSGNFGLRYVNIGSSTDGFTNYPSLGASDPGDPKNNLPQDDKDFGNNAYTSETINTSYSTFLPSFNIKVSLNDDMLVRFALSKAIALPDLGKKRNYTVISEDNVIANNDGTAEVDRYIGESGNPYLKPMEAIQYDLTFEYYFADVGSVSATAFGKDLKNYFIDGAFPRQFTNNGVTKTVDITGPINGADGKISGFEVAYQQFYDFLPGLLSGLGTQFNYTYVNNSGTPNTGLGNNPSADDYSDIAFTGLPLQGLSKDTYNLALMYQYEPVELRLAYNWRSEYLLTTRDVITLLPIYSDDTGQLDASAFWDINDTFKVGMQVTNLLNETTKTLMQVNQDGTKKGRSWFMNDRRYSLVLRGNF